MLPTRRGSNRSVSHPFASKEPIFAAATDVGTSIAEPGKVPSTNQGLFTGGNGLSPTTDITSTPADRSTCTTCQFTDDFSNYWFPTLYFHGRNGSYHRVKNRLVPNRPDQAGAESALSIYYFNTRDTNRISVFPQGFRMRHGNPAARGPEDVVRFPNITYYCLNSNDRRTHEGRDFPMTFCEGGIQTTVYFPECWDGKNLDSSDHSSHVANPVGARVDHGGTCPATHPVVIPLLMMETRWDTNEFNRAHIDDWVDGWQPFVWSNGDGTRRSEGVYGGWSLYADFVFGWKGDLLKDAFAAENCPSPHFNCGNLTMMSTAEANKCSKTPMVADQSERWLDQLPGGVKQWS